MEEVSAAIRSLADGSARSRRERYGVALLATAVGCLSSTALLALSSDPNYAPMIGAEMTSAPCS